MKKILCSLLVLCSCFVLAACTPIEGAENIDFDASKFNIKATEFVYDGNSHVFQVEYENENLDVQYSIDKTNFFTAEKLGLVGNATTAENYFVYFKVLADGYNEYVSIDPIVVRIVPNVVELKINSNYAYFSNLADAVKEVETKANIKLYSNLDLPTAVEINKEIAIDLNGKTLTATSDTAGDGILMTTGNGKLIIDGNGIINSTCQTNNYSMAIFAKDNSQVFINNGTFINFGAKHTSMVNGKIVANNNELIYARDNAVITINNGTFIGNTTNVHYGAKFTLNLKDNHPARIVVKGGTFTAFDPSNANTEPGGPVSFVANGFKVVKNNNLYTVVAE